MAIIKAKKLYLERKEACAMIGITEQTLSHYNAKLTPKLEPSYKEGRKGYYLVDDILTFWFTHFKDAPSTMNNAWALMKKAIYSSVRAEVAYELQNNTKIEHIELPPGRVQYLKDVADLELKQEKARAEKIKREMLEGKLVTPEDADGAMAEQMAIFLAFYRQDKQQLPSMLERKSASSIRSLLDAHYEKRITLVKEIFKRALRRVRKKPPTDETVLDKLYQWLNEEAAEPLSEDDAPEAIRESIHTKKKSTRAQTKRRKLGNAKGK